MRLLRFTATKVYGYLNFDVNFNKDLSFIVGVNGSGKTTVIRLIQALLTISIRDLNLIDFKTVKLEFHDGYSDRSILAKTTKDIIELQMSTVSESLKIPRLDIDDLETARRESTRGGGFLEELNIEIKQSPVGKALAILHTPVILGLERRVSSTGLIDSAFTNERMLSSASLRSRRRNFHGTLGVSLMETQVLVQDAYREVRRIQDTSNERLRSKIISSAFTYVPVDSLGDIFKLSTLDEQKLILARRDEIQKTLVGLDTSDSNLQSVISDFFDKFTKLFTGINRKDIDIERELSLELLINKAQIDRIIKIIGLVDHHKSEIEKGMTSINKFLCLMNKFYSDTQKTLRIDPVGWLQIIRNDGSEKTVEALSSGERQLLIIFANLLFGGCRKGVFIIDEPELSLHLKWQESFIPSILEASPDTQLIIATHSPEIVGEYWPKNISLNGE